MTKQIWELFFFLLLFSNCGNKKASIFKENKINFFDSIQNNNILFLDSLKLTRFNDSAKWLLYTIHCDDSAITGRHRFATNVTKTPIGFLPIKLTYIDVKNDTLSLLYHYFYDDSTYVERISNPRYLTDGIEFKISTGTTIGYIKGEGILTEQDSTSRYFNSLQPKVITFIRDNKAKLNNWFRDEAIKRNLIQ